MRRIRGLIAVALAVVVAALVVGACSGGGGKEETATPAVPPAAEASVAGGGAQADEAAASREDLAETTALEVTALPSLGPRVIQTASLSLTVQRGLFEESVDRARTIAAGLGGFVTSSSASQGQDQRLVRGTIVLRVPEQSYAQAMSQLASLGKVQAREESGTDVTQQYVDLEARARHLEAVERQLLGFLGKTETIADALVVQDRLNQVQLQLEEVRGQLRYLDDQTSFATISVTVSERGVPVAAAGNGGWGITDAWGAAGRGFERVIGGAFVGIATAAPVLLALALAFLGWRLLRRRREAGTARKATPQV
jgi:Domain of unknown function (DUF4349)